VRCGAGTQNSDIAKDAWGRLLRTANFVGTITYGSTLEAERAAAKVRAIHRRLTATDPETGERYAVDEPELLLWVHCAEIDSYLDTGRRSGFPLTDAQADAYVDEQRTAARLVGLDPAEHGIPADREQLAAYFEKVRPELAATDEAFEVFAFLQAPPVETATRRLRTTGRALRVVPGYLRWQLPPGHIPKAVGRLGPGTHPSAHGLR
jgi:uncharacterized protein (DUF2236 family)